MLRKIIRGIFNKSGYDLIKTDKGLINGLPADFDEPTIDTYNKIRLFTMTTPERVAALCAAVNHLVRNNIQGDFVECGVWKGGSTMAAIDTLLKAQDKSREIYLYDTFEGMSEPTEHDKTFTGLTADEMLGPGNKQVAASNWCYSAMEEVEKNINSLNYPASQIHYIKGKVEDTIPQTVPQKIALLRLDTDWYESTSHELKHLYPLLVPGGIIIIDDYGHWKGARKAVDEYITSQKLSLFLHRIDYSGRMAIKH